MFQGKVHLPNASLMCTGRLPKGFLAKAIEDLGPYKLELECYVKKSEMKDGIKIIKEIGVLGVSIVKRT